MVECIGCGANVSIPRSFSIAKQRFCKSCATAHGLPDLSKCEDCKTPLTDSSGRYLIRSSCYCWACAEKVLKKL
jgi:hypothetical protein